MNCPKILVDARQGGTTPGAYVPPTAPELDAVELAAFASSPATSAKARTHAAAAGFEVADVPEWPGTAVLYEAAKRRGGGAYVIRRASKSRLIVQAPHTFFDEGTLPLGCAFFHTSDARAFFINTVHRYKAAPPGEDQTADVAHLERSLFQSATLGALRSLGASTVIQLHGFGSERAMKAVVSSGEARAGVPHVDRVARALDAVLGGGVLRFPADTKELGATTNVQGKVVRASGGVFLHVELSDETRKLLIADGSKRAAVFSALLEVRDSR